MCDLLPEDLGIRMDKTKFLDPWSLLIYDPASWPSQKSRVHL